jgi:hypothetical protein
MFLRECRAFRAALSQKHYRLLNPRSSANFGFTPNQNAIADYTSWVAICVLFVQVSKCSP